MGIRVERALRLLEPESDEETSEENVSVICAENVSKEEILPASDADELCVFIEVTLNVAVANPDE